MSGNSSWCYRHINKGGWPFSTQDHGWPVSDCTAEGLKVNHLFQTKHQSVKSLDQLNKLYFLYLFDYFIES
jgi:squalene cyclase